MDQGGVRVTTDGRPEYATADSYFAFMVWRSENPKGRVGVTFLMIPERCEGLAPGVLHRPRGWETSPARELAEQLEG